MIKRANELTNKVQSNLRGGRGDITMAHILEEEQLKGLGRLFAETTIPAGGSIGKHYHEGETELYYILKGSADVDDNGEKATLQPGDMAYCCDGNYHSVENNGAEDLVMIAVILKTY